MLESRSKAQKTRTRALFPTKTSAKHFWPSGWALGQATWAKMTPKLLMTSLTKNPHPNQKFFLSAIYQTGRSVWALEQFSSAIGGGAKPLLRQPKTAVF